MRAVEKEDWPAVMQMASHAEGCGPAELPIVPGESEYSSYVSPGDVTAGPAWVFLRLIHSLWLPDSL